MAGIGFVLRRLVQADRLGANLGGYAHATLVSSGPWLFTCGALLAAQLAGRALMPTASLQRFSILVGYAFSLSLVAASPIVLVATRSLADRLHARDLAEVPGLLVGGLAAVFALLAALGLPTFALLPGLAPAERALGYAALLLAGGVWLVAAMVSALKDYKAVSASFGAGMALGAAAAAALAPGWGSVGLLAGFTLGLAVVFFGLFALVAARFPGTVRTRPSLVQPLRRYWQLAATGACGSAALWVDKWIMWFAPGATSPAPGLHAHAAYEGAMFIACLSTVPALALFLVDVETRFFERYLRYYRDIAAHATLREIRRNHATLAAGLYEGLRSVALLQGVVCLIGVLAAPVLVDAFGGGIEMVPILRFGLLGACFSVLATIAMSMLAYFDLRTELLSCSVAQLLANASFTAVGAGLGHEWHGFGWLLANVLAFAWAAWLAATRIARLQYLTFVANNGAVRSPPRDAA